MGYVGRNSETELGRWVSKGLGPTMPATSTTVDCYFVEWFV
jgi:hypothetical protein